MPCGVGFGDVEDDVDIAFGVGEEARLPEGLEDFGGAVFEVVGGVGRVCTVDVDLGLVGHFFPSLGNCRAGHGCCGVERHFFLDVLRHVGHGLICRTRAPDAQRTGRAHHIHHSLRPGHVAEARDADGRNI